MDNQTNSILMITMMDGAENCARAIEQQVNGKVELATSRRAALLTLRREEFDIVVVEESLAESDPAWAQQVWELAGLAMPIEINLSTSGAARLAREIRAALARRDGEQAMARRVVAREIENELKTSVTGLLLESELALREPAGSAVLHSKLLHLVELASDLRERLRGAAA